MKCHDRQRPEKRIFNKFENLYAECMPKCYMFIQACQIRLYQNALVLVGCLIFLMNLGKDYIQQKSFTGDIEEEVEVSYIEKSPGGERTKTLRNAFQE